MCVYSISISLAKCYSTRKLACRAHNLLAFLEQNANSATYIETYAENDESVRETLQHTQIVWHVPPSADTVQTLQCTRPEHVYLHGEGMDHQGAVLALDSIATQLFLLFVSAGRDGMIKVWSHTNELLREIDTGSGDNLGPLCFVHRHRADLGVAFANNIVYFSCEQFLPAKHLRMVLKLLMESTTTTAAAAVDGDVAIPFLLQNDNLQFYKDVFADKILHESARHALLLDKAYENLLPFTLHDSGGHNAHHFLLPDDPDENEDIGDVRASASSPVLVSDDLHVVEESEQQQRPVTAIEDDTTAAPLIVTKNAGNAVVNEPTASADFTLIKRALAVKRAAGTHFFYRHELAQRPRALRNATSASSFIQHWSEEMKQLATNAAILLKATPHLAATLSAVAMQKKFWNKKTEKIEDEADEDEKPRSLISPITRTHYTSRTIPFWLGVKLIVQLLTAKQIPNSFIAQLVDGTSEAREQLRQRLLAEQAAHARQLRRERLDREAEANRALLDEILHAGEGDAGEDEGQDDQQVEEPEMEFATQEASDLETTTFRMAAEHRRPVRRQPPRKTILGTATAAGGAKKDEKEKFLLLTTEEMQIVQRIVDFIRKHARDVQLDHLFNKAIGGDEVALAQLLKLTSTGCASRENYNFLSWLEQLFAHAALTGDRPMTAGLHTFTATRLCSQWLMLGNEEQILLWKRHVLQLMTTVKLRERALVELVRQHIYGQTKEPALQKAAEIYLGFAEREESTPTTTTAMLSRPASAAGGKFRFKSSQSSFAAASATSSNIDAVKAAAEEEAAARAKKEEEEANLIMQKLNASTVALDDGMMEGSDSGQNSPDNLDKKLSKRSQQLVGLKAQRSRLMSGGLGIVFSQKVIDTENELADQQSVTFSDKKSESPPVATGKKKSKLPAGSLKRPAGGKSATKSVQLKTVAEDREKNRRSSRLSRMSTKTVMVMPMAAASAPPPASDPDQMLMILDEESLEVSDIIRESLSLWPAEQTDGEAIRADNTGLLDIEAVAGLVLATAAENVVELAVEYLDTEAGQQQLVAENAEDDAIALATKATLEAAAAMKQRQQSKKSHRLSQDRRSSSSSGSGRISRSGIHPMPLPMALSTPSMTRTTTRSMLSVVTEETADSDSTAQRRRRSSSLSSKPRHPPTITTTTAADDSDDQRIAAATARHQEVEHGLAAGAQRVLGSARSSGQSAVEDGSRGSIGGMFSIRAVKAPLIVTPTPLQRAAVNAEAEADTNTSSLLRNSSVGFLSPADTRYHHQPQQQPQQQPAKPKTQLQTLPTTTLSTSTTPAALASAQPTQQKILPTSQPAAPEAAATFSASATTVTGVRRAQLPAGVGGISEKSRRGGAAKHNDEIHRALVAQALTMLLKIEALLRHERMSREEQLQLLGRLLLLVESGTVASANAAQRYIQQQQLLEDGSGKVPNDLTLAIIRKQLTAAGGGSGGGTSKQVKIAYAVIISVIRELPDLVKATVAAHFIVICYKNTLLGVGTPNNISPATAAVFDGGDGDQLAAATAAAAEVSVMDTDQQQPQQQSSINVPRAVSKRPLSATSSSSVVVKSKKLPVKSSEKLLQDGGGVPVVPEELEQVLQTPTTKPPPRVSHLLLLLKMDSSCRSSSSSVEQ